MIPDGFSVAIFYAAVAAVWAFVRITSPRERKALLDWTLIAVVCFGAIGFTWELIATPP